MTKEIKIMGIAVVGVLALGALLYFNQPSENEKLLGAGGEHNALQTDKLIHDFGTISMKDGNVRTTFKVKNTTPEMLVLSKLYTTCMCTEARLLINGKSEGPFGMPGHGPIPVFEQRIDPNQEADIEVEYNPNAHGPSGVGMIERSVILEGQGGKLTTVNIKANVTP